MEWKWSGSGEKSGEKNGVGLVVIFCFTRSGTRLAAHLLAGDDLAVGNNLLSGRYDEGCGGKGGGWILIKLWQEGGADRNRH